MSLTPIGRQRKTVTSFGSKVSPRLAYALANATIVVVT